MKSAELPRAIATIAICAAGGVLAILGGAPLVGGVVVVAGVHLLWD